MFTDILAIKHDFMKIFTIVLILMTMFFASSCLHMTTRKVFDGEKPKICDNLSSLYYSDAKKLNDYTVEDLLTLNKCGMEYTPEISLNSKIMGYKTYPIPALLEQLSKEQNDEFRYYIIETIDYIFQYKSLYNSEPYKYDEQLKEDKNKIISGVSEAIAKMQDKEYKTDAAKKLFLIKKYYEDNP